MKDSSIMKQKELLQLKIFILYQYLALLSDDSYSNEELGLPKTIERHEEVNQVLDRINRYKKRLLQLDDE